MSTPAAATAADRRIATATAAASKGDRVEAAVSCLQGLRFGEDEVKKKGKRNRKAASFQNATNAHARNTYPQASTSAPRRSSSWCQMTGTVSYTDNTDAYHEHEQKTKKRATEKSVALFT